MCGAIGRVTDSPFVQALMDILGIRFDDPSDWNIRPNATLPMVIGGSNTNQVQIANWWLFQSRTAEGYSYDARYKSFNSRAEKLFTTRKQEFSKQRCIIPASCFYEWKGLRYRIEPVNSAIAFGGLYRKWPTAANTSHYSCSIITLPPHPRFSHIHDKSLPLMLLPQEFEQWLDPSFQDINFWLPALQPSIRFDLKVTPVDKKNPAEAIGETEIIVAD